MEPKRDDVRAWLDAAIAKTGDTASGLARRAGLATTTITRFLNDPAAPMLSWRSLAKIAQAANVTPLGVPPPNIAQPRAVGLHEPDGVRYESADMHPVSRAIEAYARDRVNTDPWQLRTDALREIGLFSGDILLVSLSDIPKAGDVVCAQHYEWDATNCETIFRLYEPPYLIASISDRRTRKPLLVDNERVVIMGVAIAIIRELGG